MLTTMGNFWHETPVRWIVRKPLVLNKTSKGQKLKFIAKNGLFWFEKNAKLMHQKQCTMVMYKIVASAFICGFWQLIDFSFLKTFYN